MVILCLAQHLFNFKRGDKMKKLDIKVGDKFDDMELIGETYNDKGIYCFIAKCCKCGREKLMIPNTLKRRSGTRHSSCGKGLKTINKTFHSRWTAMRTRTTNPNYAHYEDYGGRGINSDEFEYFIDFYDAMYESFVECSKKWGETNTSLERIDVNGNYCKDNCIWIHIDEQKGNQRKTVEFVATNEELGMEIHSKNLTKFCRDYNLNASCIRDVMTGRLTSYQGWKIERV